MELRQLWNVIRRRWALALIPAVIVLAVGVAMWRPAPPAYNAGVRFIVGQPPGAAAAEFDEQRYFNWTTSEYIVNGLADWVRGGKFAEAVSKRLAAQGIDVPAGAIQGGLAAGLGLALLAHYLDPTVRDREEVARAGLAVLVEIPKEKK